MGLSEIFLLKVAEIITPNDMVKFAIQHLGIKYHQIKHIKADYSGTGSVEVNFQILRRWSIREFREDAIGEFIAKVKEVPELTNLHDMFEDGKLGPPYDEGKINNLYHCNAINNSQL